MTPSAPPPGWYPDPGVVGRQRWWNGTAWASLTSPPPPLPRFARLGAAAALRQGWGDVIRLRRSVAGITVVGVVSVVLIYGAATVGNGLVFGYDFFNDVAPSRTADVAAVVCLWLMLPLVGLACVWTFGAFCALTATEDGGAGPWRASRRDVLRNVWWTVPSFVLTFFGVLCVVPGPFLAGPLAGSAAARVAGRLPSGHVERTLARQLAIGLVPTGWSVLIWGLAAASTPLGTPPMWGATVCFVLAALGSFVVMAWVALASGRLQADDAQWDATVRLDDVLRRIATWPLDDPTAALMVMTLDGLAVDLPGAVTMRAAIEAQVARPQDAVTRHAVTEPALSPCSDVARELLHDLGDHGLCDHAPIS